MQKKKIAFGFLLIAIILMAIPAYAEDEGIILFCLADIPDESGNCDVTVELSGCKGIAMMQFCIYYESEKLSCIGAEAGSLFIDNISPTINTRIPGIIVLSWDSLTPLQNEGSVLLLHMSFQRDEPAFMGFDVEDVVFAREDFLPVKVDCKGCMIDREIASDDRIAVTESDDLSMLSEADPVPYDTPPAESEQALTGGESESLWPNHDERDATAGENGAVTPLEDDTDLVTGTNELSPDSEAVNKTENVQWYSMQEIEKKQNPRNVTSFFEIAGMLIPLFALAVLVIRMAV